MVPGLCFLALLEVWLATQPLPTSWKVASPSLALTWEVGRECMREDSAA